ncbi:MAG: hypothetical protein HXX10_18880 [Rhodoplanes sp.]|uniref:hypothetical protein n=1 Tax=Rhodoplanes sp. TaxID=1968906 RepID=UPI0017F5440B|nr:hypothetical protein [Rhodoplanes sp.]NVO16103.1 hypothetical protein [Rhodoplanes sp.]
MPDQNGNPFDFSLVPPERHAAVAAVSLEYAARVVQQTHQFNELAAPFACEIADRLPSAPEELQVAFINLVNLLEVYTGKVEEGFAEFAGRLSAAVATGETKQ